MKSTLSHFKTLPEPHRSNCIGSMPIHELTGTGFASLFAAVCFIDTDNGFCPKQYYTDLLHALMNDLIKLQGMTIAEIKSVKQKIFSIFTY